MTDPKSNAVRISGLRDRVDRIEKMLYHIYALLIGALGGIITTLFQVI